MQNHFYGSEALNTEDSETEPELYFSGNPTSKSRVLFRKTPTQKNQGQSGSKRHLLESRQCQKYTRALQPSKVPSRSKKARPDYTISLNPSALKKLNPQTQRHGKSVQKFLDPPSRSSSPSQRKKLVKLRSKTTLQAEGKLLIGDLETPKQREDASSVTTAKKQLHSIKREVLLPEIIKPGRKNLQDSERTLPPTHPDGDGVHFRSTHLAKDLFGTPRMYRSESITGPDRDAGPLEMGGHPHTTKSQSSQRFKRYYNSMSGIFSLNNTLDQNPRLASISNSPSYRNLRKQKQFLAKNLHIASESVLEEDEEQPQTKLPPKVNSMMSSIPESTEHTQPPSTLGHRTPGKRAQPQQGRSVLVEQILKKKEEYPFGEFYQKDKEGYSYEETEEKEHYNSLVEEEHFAEHVEARLHQLQFEQTLSIKGDILENYSFEMERINHLEIPKNISKPVEELEVAIVPSKECELFDEIAVGDGRLQFRRDDTKILIATNERELIREKCQTQEKKIEGKLQLPVEKVFGNKGNTVWEKVASNVLKEVLETGELGLLIPQLESNEMWRHLHAATFQPEFALPIEAPALEFFTFLPLV